MLTLRSSMPSPFVRKVKIAAALLGLADRIKLEPADTTNPSDSMRMQNPLGKIPILLTEDGAALFDSRVIVEYLDHLAGGGRIIPAEPKARFAALRLQALCDGILDASILRVYEGRFRSEEKREQTWIDYQTEKVTRALDWLEKNPPAVTALPDVGQITLACTLGYLDLRFEGAWRKSCPTLVKWHDDFAARVPAFAQTRAEA